MKKMIFAITIVSALSMPVHAAFWDSWFGGSDEATATPDSAPSVAETAGLIPSLTSQLGVSDDQAKGGMGALLQLAQTNLSADEFGKLGESIPNVEGLVAAAPLLDNSGNSAKFGELLSQVGGVGNTLSGAAKLTSQFESLGLNSGMIGQFASILMGYFGGDGDMTSLLQKGLGTILG